MLSEGVNRAQRSSLRGVNRVFRTLSGDTPLPILQTPSAGHCLDTHGIISGDLISVILRKYVHLLVLFLLGRITLSFTPENS